MTFAPNSILAQPPNYDDDIKPIFRQHCLTCHNEDDAEADIDLSTFAATIKGGSSGAILKAGRPQASILLQAITHGENVEAMPPTGPKLSDEEIKVIDTWIRSGLIEGRGGKSQLRMVELVKTNGEVVDSPIPVNLSKQTTKTIRAPVPQAVATSPGAPLIAVSGQEQVLLYGKNKSDSKSNLELVGSLAFPEGNIHDLKFNNNGTILLAGGGRGAHSGKVVLFDVKSGKRVGEFGDEVDAALAADLSADNQFIALGNSKRTVKIFDVKAGKLLHRIKKHTDWITAISFSPDGKYVATGDRSGGLHVWEPSTGLIVYTLDEHRQSVQALSWRTDNRLLASGAEDGIIVLWDMKDGFAEGHVAKSDSRYTRRTGVLSFDFTSQGGLLSSGRDGNVKMWNSNGELEFKIPLTDSLVTAASKLNPFKQAIVGTIDGYLHALDLEARKQIQTLALGAGK